MNFGMFTDFHIRQNMSQAEAFDESFRQAEEAERLGVASGCLAVQVLPLTNPLRIAEEAATVDHISKGRFDFGVGRSGLTRYYQGYNVPYVESRSRFLE